MEIAEVFERFGISSDALRTMSESDSSRPYSEMKAAAGITVSSI